MVWSIPAKVFRQKTSAYDTGIEFMTNDADVHRAAVTYLKVRLIGGPAILIMMAAFGALRGLQDMRTPLRIAVAQNVLNVILD